LGDLNKCPLGDLNKSPWENYLEGGGSEEIIKSTRFCKVHYVLNSDIKPSVLRHYYENCINTVGDEPRAEVQSSGNPARESGSALSSSQAPHDQEITTLSQVIRDLGDISITKIISSPVFLSRQCQGGEMLLFS